MASQRGGREDDKRVSVSSRQHRYGLKGRVFFSCIRNCKYIYEVVNLQPLKKRSFFLCLIQIRCGGALWGNDRNSVTVTISQCVFSGGAQENEYEAEGVLRGPLHSCINGCCPIELVSWPANHRFVCFQAFFFFTFH